MLFKFFTLLLLFMDSLCFDGSGRVVDNKLDGDKQLGYFLKSVNRDDGVGRSLQNSIVRDSVKIEHNPGGPTRDDTSKRTIVIIVEPDNTVKDGLLKDVTTESSKNVTDPVLPLHVANTARQQCVEGYQADENGICQKTMQPKSDKSFKLRRKKRAEQTAPKLSYADVVKYGRNPPKELLTTIKAEIVTKKPTEIKIPATTPQPMTTNHPKSFELPKTSVKAAITPPAAALTTSQPKSYELSKTSVKAPATLPATVRVAAVTQKPVPVASPATLKPAAPGTVASKTDKPAVVGTVPPVVKKPASKPSIVGDINQAFLFGEKSSVVSQSMDGKVKPVVVPVAPKKTIDAARLRRWIGMI